MPNHWGRERGLAVAAWVVLACTTAIFPGCRRANDTESRARGATYQPTAEELADEARARGLTQAELAELSRSIADRHSGSFPGGDDDGWRDFWLAEGPIQSGVRAKLVAGDLVPPAAELFIAGAGVRGEQALVQRLCYRSPGVFVVVETPEDMVGRVQIDSPEVALRFARLFTSPATVKYLCPPWWLEVVPLAAVDDQFLFGRVEDDIGVLAERPSWPPGLYGVLSDKQWADLDLEEARVERQGDAFVVARWLFRATPDECTTRTVHMVHQTVTPRGKIRLVITRSLRLWGPELKVPLLK